jgi:serine/threonine-protein kinase
MPSRSAVRDRWVGATVAGRFRLDAAIGAGAMGRVYRGRELPAGEPVAIKLLHDHLGRDPRVAKRFDREARAASRLSHPSSLKILDFGEAEDGTLYIAMELLEGDDLQAVIDSDAPLAPARIADLMVQTLRALDQAHAAGIVHRDLKPENVVVIEDAGSERVKVCDFGIAKIVEGDSAITAITKDGYICGTPEYMAPEQARGEAIDARTDVYAAGVMLYQMLTGTVPFRAQSALAVITKHVKEAPLAPREARPEWHIPEPLERIALTALAKRPEERYPSAAAMAEAIERATAELPDEHASGAGPTDAALESPAPAVAEIAPADGRGWYVALAFALALLAFGVWLWIR